MAKKKDRIAERGAIVEQAAIDWLSCSTYDGDQYALVRDMIDLINEKGEKAKAKKLRGYDSTLFGWASYGEGTQKGNSKLLAGLPHFVINANGKESDELFSMMLAEPEIKRDQWNFSRLDVQLTIPTDRDTDLGILAIMGEKGQLGEFNGRGKPKIRGYTSETGHTLYIGSGSSQKQIRFYDKPLIIKGKRQPYERFETQYRDDYANPLVTKLFKKAPTLDRSILLNNLKYQYSLLPDALQAALSFRSTFTGAVSVPLKMEITDKTEASKLAWFKGLKRTIRDMAALPGEQGEQVRAILLESLVSGSTRDNLAGWMDYKLLSPEGEIIDPLQ